MSPRQRRHLLVAGLLLVPLAAFLISRPSSLGRWPSRDEDRDTPLPGHRFPVQALAFDSDGTTLTSADFFAGSPEGKVEAEVMAWDLGTRQCRAMRTQSLGELLALALAPGGRTLAASGRDGTLRLWDTALWHEQTLLGRSTSHVAALAFSEDGRHLATADHWQAAPNLTLWDVATGRPKTHSHGPKQRSWALAFAPDAEILASGNEDGTIRLWDVATGELRATLKEHASAVSVLAFSPHGQVLASGDLGGTLKLWDVAAEKARPILATSQAEATALTFAPDRRTLAVAIGHAVQLYDVGTGRLVTRLEAHKGQVKCLAYSPTGTLLASGSSDRTVRLWDVAKASGSALP